jgi:hypothetical protein
MFICIVSLLRCQDMPSFPQSRDTAVISLYLQKLQQLCASHAVSIMKGMAGKVHLFENDISYILICSQLYRHKTRIPLLMIKSVLDYPEKIQHMSIDTLQFCCIVYGVAFKQFQTQKDLEQQYKKLQKFMYLSNHCTFTYCLFL